MNKEPETYEELIRYKRCVDLTKYYQLSEENLNKIYNYLASNENGTVIGNKNGLTLKLDYQNGTTPEIMPAICTDSTIDGIKLTNTYLSVIPHYNPVIRGSGGGGYHGGSSSNNNHNNNNNNNNNR